MAYFDKDNLLQNLPVNGVSLELGCGSRKKHIEAIGIDMLDFDGVNIVGDVFDVLKEFPDQSVNKIYTYHFLEHIEKLPELFQELARVLKDDGLLFIVDPHFSNPYYYSDITHKNFFGLYTMNYFSSGGGFKRTIPNYQQKKNYMIDSVQLVFKSFPPYYLRHGIKKFFEIIFNFNSYTKELYEEFFCYIVPCYEVQYSLRRVY